MSRFHSWAPNNLGRTEEVNDRPHSTIAQPEAASTLSDRPDGAA